MDPYRIASALAPKSRHKWFKHAAIVVRAGSVVSVGYNHDTTHAEVSALNKLWPSERRGTRVYSIRMTKSGAFRMAKPCPNCMRYMKESGVRCIYYTNSQGDMEKIKP